MLLPEGQGICIRDLGLTQCKVAPHTTISPYHHSRTWLSMSARGIMQPQHVPTKKCLFKLFAVVANRDVSNPQ